MAADDVAAAASVESIAVSDAAAADEAPGVAGHAVGDGNLQGSIGTNTRVDKAQHQARPVLDGERIDAEGVDIEPLDAAMVGGRDRPESQVAGSGADQQQQRLPVEHEELQQRALTMFCCGPQSSVAPGGGTCVSKVTLLLLVMIKGVIKALFNDHASRICRSPERPDLRLAQEEALGHLVGSLVVGELLPSEARKAGKRVDYYAGKESTEGEKEKESARQKKKGLRRKAAAGDAELEAKLVAVDAAVAAARSARLAKVLDLELPKKASRLVEPRAPRPEEEDAAFYRRLKGCREVAVAIRAAVQLERYVDEEPDDAGFFDEEERDVALVRYTHAVRNLNVALADHKEEVKLACVPQVEQLKANPHNSEPCVCGQGRRARWPWYVQTPKLGFCHSEQCGFEEIKSRELFVELTAGRNFAW